MIHLFIGMFFACICYVMMIKVISVITLHFCSFLLFIVIEDVAGFFLPCSFLFSYQ